MDWRPWYEEKFPDIREESDRRYAEPVIRVRKKLVTTVEREARERKSWSRKNICKVCTYPRPCACDDEQYFG